MKKKLCVISGSRADYGLLKPLLKKIQNSFSFNLQLLVTGSHLSRSHGTTINEIKRDEFIISDTIEIINTSDNPVDIAKYISKGVDKFSKSFEKLKPDLVFILGDRYEIFSSCVASFILGIPIAHHSGGELTEGAFDDAIRHSITKMSNIHFVAAEEYKKRVIQLGENPDNVHVVGGFGAENINNIKLLSKTKVEKELGLSFNQKILIATFHSETLNLDNTVKNFKEMLSALKLHDDITIIFTLPNADTYNQTIIKILKEYKKERKNLKIYKSLGTNLYLSCLKYVDGTIGNSSSGITEVPSFKKGTINIGDRQKGRLRAKSIIDCNPTKKEINQAINKLFSKEFQKMIRDTINPYEMKDTSDMTIKILELMPINKVKTFYDIDFKY